MKGKILYQQALVVVSLICSCRPVFNLSHFNMYCITEISERINLNMIMLFCIFTILTTAVYAITDETEMIANLLISVSVQQKRQAF